jgi:hypothetical protein
MIVECVCDADTELVVDFVRVADSVRDTDALEVSWLDMDMDAVFTGGIVMLVAVVLTEADSDEVYVNENDLVPDIDVVLLTMRDTLRLTVSVSDVLLEIECVIVTL